MKRCSICKLQKDIKEFDKFIKAPDGLDYRCKACRRIFSKGRADKNAERNFGQNPYLKGGVQRCSGYCKKDIPVENFHKNARTRSGLEAICKDCSRAKHKISWKKENYGLTPERYADKLKAQNYACAMCGKSESWKQHTGTLCELSVDHDHSCCPGQKSCGRCVRDLLCARCNHLLGNANDDIELLLLAIKYLRKHSNGGNPTDSGDNWRTNSSGESEISGGDRG